ncbi:TPA: RloB family protein [Elizabethkingia anophelis]
MAKRTRATKVTDIKGQKPWLKNKGNSSYKMESKEMNKFILLVCEGQSEELYFKSFPVVSCRVSTVNLGQSKDSLVNATIELMKEDDYDEVWCVFDMDINIGAREKAAYDNAIDKAYANNIKVAYSNDSFELWYCLHFEHLDQQHRRDFYYNFLSQKFNNNYTNEGKKYDYCKTVYSSLNSLGDQKKAIERAKKLHIDQNHLPYSQQNPITLVYQIVELLNANMRN